MPRGSRFGRWGRRAALALGVLLVGLGLAYGGFRRLTTIDAPADQGPSLPTAADLQPARQGARLQLGESSLERRRGIWHIELRGDPRELGNAHGLLVRRLSDRFERHMQDLMASYVPSRAARWLIGNLVRWRYRDLLGHVPAPRAAELAALSRNLADTASYPERPFQRVLYYHALYDMTQRLERSPLLGCTAFAAWGERTVDGHMIIGRNFDFDAGEIFDREKAVIAFHPRGRIAFVSIAWPGMLGVVTGVNARGLFVSLNAARSDAPFVPGIPVVLLVRELLERAGDVDAALAVLARYPVMGAQSLLLADRQRAVAVELAPGRRAVRRARDHVLPVSNHFLDPVFARDRANAALRRYSTSDARHRRLTALLAGYPGGTRARLGVREALALLRDRAAADGKALPLGHRAAIDALRATHAVVVDLTAMRLWVSRGPALLGPFVAIDLAGLLDLRASSEPAPLADLPADTVNGSPALARYRMVQAQLRHARRLERSGRLEAGYDFALRAARAAPRLPEARKLAGDLAWRLDRRAEAQRHYAAFLTSRPPYLAEVEEVRARRSRR